MKEIDSSELHQRLFVNEKKKLDECFKAVAYGVVDAINGHQKPIILPYKPSMEVRNLYILLDESMSCSKQLVEVLRHLPDSSTNVKTISTYDISSFANKMRSNVKLEKDCILKILSKEATLDNLLDVFRKYQQNVKLPFVRCKNGLELQYLMERNAQINIEIMVLLWNLLDERITFLNKVLC